jgi:hypothetical protein
MKIPFFDLESVCALCGKPIIFFKYLVAQRLVLSDTHGSRFDFIATTASAAEHFNVSRTQLPRRHNAPQQSGNASNYSTHCCNTSFTHPITRPRAMTHLMRDHLPETAHQAVVKHPTTHSTISTQCITLSQAAVQKTRMLMLGRQRAGECIARNWWGVCQEGSGRAG